MLCGVHRNSDVYNKREQTGELCALRCMAGHKALCVLPAIFEAAMRQHGGPVDAIFGLSDSLALAARDAGRALGLIDEHTVIVGINGAPLTLAAIADGSMAATVDTPAAALGAEAVTLASQAACGAPLPPYFGYAARLVTALCLVSCCWIWRCRTLMGSRCCAAARR